MKNFSNFERLTKELQQSLNLNREIGGILKNNLTINRSEQKQGDHPITKETRGEVRIGNGRYRYHTHPRISYPVPSAEDIVSSFSKCHREYSILVTGWGIFIMKNEIHIRITEENKKKYIKDIKTDLKNLFKIIKPKVVEKEGEMPIKAVTLTTDLYMHLGKFIDKINKMKREDGKKLVHIRFKSWKGNILPGKNPMSTTFPNGKNLNKEW